MTTTTLSRAQYAGSDFQTHYDEMLARAQAKFAASFNDFSLSSLGVMLLDLMAFGADTLSFYIDRRATENYLSTARTRRAIARLTRQLGYKMGAATASSIDLRVSLTQTYAFDVPIDKGFRFQGPNDSVYEAAQPAVIPAGSLGPVIVPCYQGVTTGETFTASGQPNQVYQLKKLPADQFVVQGYNTVVVDALPYVELPFLDVVATPHYEIGYNDDPPTLRFGDGVAGVIPPAGATISIVYVASKGKEGQAAKDIDGIAAFSVVNPLVVSFQNITLAIDNPDGSIGGDDPEDIEHARAFAPRVWRSRLVAVTEDDYDALAGSYTDALFGRVAVAKAVSVHSASNDLELLALLNLLRAEILPVEGLVVRGLDGDTSYEGILDHTATILAASTSAGALVTQLAAANNDVLTDIQGAVNVGRQVKTAGVEITADGTQITTKAAALTTAINALPAGGSDSISSTTRDSLLQMVTSVVTTTGQVLTGASSVQSGMATVLSQLDEASDKLAGIGLPPVLSDSTATALLPRIQAFLDLITSETGTGIQATNVPDIRAAVHNIGINVSATCDKVFDHVDQIVSSDCQANLVSVPILAIDSAGFYTPPSIGLIQSLQAYLDARKEVTQVVRVLSGSSFLVRAAVKVRLGVAPGKSLTQAAGTAEASVLSVLRRRAFGASLYQSALWDVTKAGSGVVYANVIILGYLDSNNVLQTDKLDSNGNLIVKASEVVTYGSVTVETEVVKAS